VGLELIGTLPAEPKIAEFDLVGRPIVELDETSPLYAAVKEILHKAGVIR
jgi:CO dehydrogenase maturation factor